MKCPYCEHPLKDGAKFCSHCGGQMPAPALVPQTPSPQMPLAPPNPPAHVKINSAPAEKTALQIGTYRVTGAWRNYAPIYWVTRGEPTDGAPRLLAIAMPGMMPKTTLEKLRALAHPNLARVLDQAKDKQGRWYLVVEHVEGEPLDTVQEKLGAERSTKVFEKILKAMIYLHEAGWVITARAHQASGNGFRAQFQNLFGIGKPAPAPSQEPDPAKRLQQAFAIDPHDNLMLFDFTIWENAPAVLAEREERIQQDMRLTVGMLHWLRTSGRLTKELERVRQTSGKFEQFILNVLQQAYPTFEEMGEKFSELVPKQEPSKTIPLPKAIPSLVTRRLPITKLGSVGMTDNGKQRDHNEDNYLAQPLDAASGLFVVADGMGGHSAGEVASKLAIEAIYQSAIAQWGVVQQSGTPDTIRQMFADWIKDANTRILTAGQAQGNNMGTTLTAALVVNGAVYAANVGDSRTYLYRSGQLHPLTRDHSLVASLVQAGLLKPEEIYTHPQRNQIFRSLGQQKNVNVDVFDPVPLGHEDRLVLCSDGLWEMVHEPQMQTILAHYLEPKDACAALIQAANQNGGEDNITVVISRVTFE